MTMKIMIKIRMINNNKDNNNNKILITIILGVLCIFGSKVWCVSITNMSFKGLNMTVI